MTDEPVPPVPPAEEQPTLQSYPPAYTSEPFPPEPVPPVAPPPPPKKKTNTWLIVLIVVLVVLCCCCLLSGILAWNFGDSIMQGIGIY
jgi:hypothetical protein